MCVKKFEVAALGLHAFRRQWIYIRPLPGKMQIFAEAQ